MQEIQKIFIRLQENKKKAKDINKMLADAYMQNQEFAEHHEKIKVLAEKKKQIKIAINQLHTSEVTQLEDLKIDIAADKEMISDIVLSTMMKGETVEVKDQYEQPCLPIFSVKFVKE